MIAWCNRREKWRGGNGLSVKRNVTDEDRVLLLAAAVTLFESPLLGVSCSPETYRCQFYFLRTRLKFLVLLTELYRPLNARQILQFSIGFLVPALLYSRSLVTLIVLSLSDFKRLPFHLRLKSRQCKRFISVKNCT